MITVILGFCLILALLALLFQNTNIFQNYTTQQAPRAQVIKHKSLGQHKAEERKEQKKKTLIRVSSNLFGEGFQDKNEIINVSVNINNIMTNGVIGEYSKNSSTCSSTVCDVIRGLMSNEIFRTQLKPQNRIRRDTYIALPQTQPEVKKYIRKSQYIRVKSKTGGTLKLGADYNLYLAYHKGILTFLRKD